MSKRDNPKTPGQRLPCVDAQIQNGLSEGSNSELKGFGLVFLESEAPKTTKSGQLSTCQRNAIEMAFLLAGI